MRFSITIFLLYKFSPLWYIYRKAGEASAYSVFNENCEAIDGTLTAQQFEREIRHGVMWYYIKKKIRNTVISWESVILGSVTEPLNMTISITVSSFSAYHFCDLWYMKAKLYFIVLFENCRKWPLLGGKVPPEVKLITNHLPPHHPISHLCWNILTWHRFRNWYSVPVIVG